MSNRLVRVCELLKRELGVLMLRDLKFEAPLVSVRGVDITPDLRKAHVFITALGTPGQKKAAITLLEKNRVSLQKELSRRVILKNTPTLHFALDESIERGNRVLALLDEFVPEEPSSEQSEEEQYEEE